MSLAYMAGIPKLMFEKKLWGGEFHNLASEHPIMDALDEKFSCPQSRIASISRPRVGNVQRNGNINLLLVRKLDTKFLKPQGKRK